MRSLIGLTSLLIAAPAFAQQPDAAAIDTIFAGVAKPRTPGCAIGVAKDGETVLNRAYGSADLEHDVAINAKTIFEAGSVSKQFTAAAILLLAQDGKLQLTDDVRKYIPELPDYGATITLDHLLNHTSGLRDWGAVAALAGWPRGTRSYTMDDVLAIIARQRALNYAPGTEYSYTNSGYNLLAMIVKRASGSRLADFTKARLFEPLGMQSTSWRDNHRRVVPDRATAYSRDGEAFAQFMPFEDAYGNGGLLTTVEDLLAWNEALSSNRLGAEVTRRLAEQAVLADGKSIAYARGLFVQSRRGQTEISHGGATGGYRAWLGRFPASRLSVAMLCNNAAANPGLAYRVAELFLPAPDAAPAPAATPASAAGPAAAVPVDLALAGSYVREGSGMPLQVDAEGGKLKITGRPPLVATAPGRFRAGAAELRFESGGRLSLTLPDGEVARYRRAEPFAPGPAALRAFAGRYQSEEARAAYLVTAEDGRLTMRLEERPQVTLPLRPAYRDAFEVEGVGIVRFRRNRSGRVTGLGFGVSRVRDLLFARTGRVPQPAVAAAPPR